jgi:hypothetical protein
MEILGIEGMSTREINEEINNGAKFVIYRYCFSIIVLTFKRTSGIYFVKAGENRVFKGLQWTLITFFFGWWGIPWGPIYSVQSLATNLAGGKDVTQEIKKSMDIRELVS